MNKTITVKEVESFRPLTGDLSSLLLLDSILALLDVSVPLQGTYLPYVEMSCLIVIR